ncbi:MAG: hypothetical protein ABI280_11215 [Ginsengibacter sp.]
MEQTGHISVTIKGKTIKGNLNPKDIDIAETRELLTDVETLLFPTKTEKDERPKVAYEVKEGSVKNIFYLTLAKAIMFSALIAEVGNRGNVELLEPKAAAVIDKWQRKSYNSGREYVITSSVSEEKSLITINSASQFIAAQSDWVNTSLYLYGKIYEEGGLSKINLHILTDRFGKLTVTATEEQLTEGDQKLFKVYGLWVKGKQNIATGQLKDLELIDYLKYQPEYEEIVLQKLIKKATTNWSAIKDKDEWLTEIRGGVNE